MADLFTGYNQQEEDRQLAVANKSREFAQDVVNINPGMCFMLPIKDGSLEHGYVINIRYVKIVDISGAGVDCLIADIEGVSTENDADYKKITQRREVYPSFTDVLWNDCVIYVVDNKTMFDTIVTAVGKMIEQTGQTKRGGSVDTGIDAFVYTGNNIDIASHFGETAEDPEKDPSGDQSDEPKDDPPPTDNPSNER